VQSGGRTPRIRRKLAPGKQLLQPPWPLLPNLVQKLRQSGAAATIVAPRWTRKAWHQVLTEMASEELIVAPRRELFQPGRRALRGTRGSLH
jgi:trans-aconitate methyltransferase